MNSVSRWTPSLTSHNSCAALERRGAFLSWWWRKYVAVVLAWERTFLYWGARIGCTAITVGAQRPVNCCGRSRWYPACGKASLRSFLGKGVLTKNVVFGKKARCEKTLRSP